MRVVVAVVGKPKNDAIGAAIREYEDRARRYWPLHVYEVKDEPVRAGNIELTRQREGARLATAIDGAHIVACEVGGRRMTSPEFAVWMQQRREAATDLAFVVGGAHGIASELSERAAARLSFSSWTLPHELARLVLAEQLYRAGTIVRNEPYHKGGA